MQLDIAKIKALRKKNKLTQQDMADILGLKNQYPYFRKEKGEQKFTAEEIYKIAIYFNKDLDYFFKQEVAENATNQKEQEVS